MKKLTTTLVLVLTVAFSTFAQYNLTDVKQWYALKQADFNLSSQDISDFVITDQYTDKHNGVTHIYLRQRVNGIEIADATSSMHLDRNGHIAYMNNGFVSNVQAKAATPTAGIGAQVALSNAASHVEMKANTLMAKASAPMVNNQLIIYDASVSPEPVKIRLHYITNSESLQLVYYVELFNNQTSDWWTVKVDANNGAIIGKDNYTVSCNFERDAYKREFNFTDLASPQPDHSTQFAKTGNGTYNIVPLPYESPNFGARQLVSGTPTSNASPYGWHDTDGVTGADFTITRGNNVYAYDDRASINGPGFSPNGGTNLNFDFPFVIDSNTYNLPAAVTNLFYMNNIVHDIYYNYGFTEVSGNFQANNYGKGGTQGDAVHAEAQDGSGTSNANFSAPSDGQLGRMQMYLWPPTSNFNSIVNYPASISQNIVSLPAGFGQFIEGKLTKDVVLFKDNSTPGSYTGCGVPTNPSELSGKIVLVDKTSNCSYFNQIYNVQSYGAAAVIVSQNTTSAPVSMTGFNFSKTIVIPSYMISKADGDSLKKRLADTVVNMTIIAPSHIIDGDLDNGVIIHESGHGVSLRLTGGPSKTNKCLTNAEQAGEGWSDFFALAFTARPTDKANDGRGLATYVANQTPSGMGLRTYKYSRNMTINPMTYSYISSNTEVHYIGSFWAAVLWDMYWNMVDRYGFSTDLYNGTAGNNKAIQIVIDGLKLQPCNPGFIDSRNAILAADSIDFGGANKDIIWGTFARRGMGYTASQGSATSASDQTQKFDMPPGITFNGIQEFGVGNTIQVAPNPTNGNVFLMLPTGMNSAEVNVIDVTGRTVLSENLTADVNSQIKLNLGDEKNGIYFITVKSNDSLLRTKVVLAK